MKHLLHVFRIGATYEALMRGGKSLFQQLWAPVL
jgi:hypothetical protein